MKVSSSVLYCLLLPLTPMPPSLFLFFQELVLTGFELFKCLCVFSPPLGLGSKLDIVYRVQKVDLVTVESGYLVLKFVSFIPFLLFGQALFLQSVEEGSVVLWLRFG